MQRRGPEHEPAARVSDHVRDRRLTTLVAVAVILSLLAPVRPAAAAEIDFARVPGPLNDAVGSMAYDDGVVVGRIDVHIPPTHSFVWDGDAVTPILPSVGNGSIFLTARSNGDGYTGLADRVPAGNGMEVITWDPVNGLRRGGTLGGYLAQGVGFVGPTIVGYGTTSPSPERLRSFRWEPDHPLVELEGLSDGNVVVQQTDGTRVAAGYAIDAGGVTHLVRWVELGPIDDLGAIDDAIGVHVAAIGQDGSLYGTVTRGAGRSVFSWQPGSGITIRPVPANLAVLAVNRHGQWVGIRCTDVNGYCQNGDAVRWEADGTVTTLAASESFAVASAINDRGQIVGFVRTGDRSSRGFLWDPGCGLTDLGDGGGALEPSAISNTGIVTGSHIAPGEPFTAFRLTLHLEPCTPSLQGAAEGAAASLAWAPVDGRDAPVQAFRIYRDDEPVAETQATATAWHDTDAPAGSHRYEVAAVNAFGESARSQPVTIASVSPAAPTPAAPAAVAALPTFVG